MTSASPSLRRAGSGHKRTLGQSWTKRGWHLARASGGWQRIETSCSANISLGRCPPSASKADISPFLCFLKNTIRPSKQHMKLQRNDRCPCGSGKKYKQCCYLVPVKNTEITRAASLTTTWDELAELVSQPMPVYRLKVVLIRMGFNEIQEEISRTFEVEGNQTLYDLHMGIQHAFNWDNDHMFSFYFGGKLFDRENEYSGNPLGEHIVSGMGTPSKSATATQIRDLQLFENSAFLYLFDYGDELVHEVIVEKIHDNNDKVKKLPAVVSAFGTPPPQYGEVE